MKKRLLEILLLACICFTSCADKRVKPIDDNIRTWYEVFVYSFADSNGDGIGDIKGLTKKLDYIEDLGFNGIWLMPINPSTTYHKYDVIDYKAIDPQYGTLEDFDEFLAQCEKRNIKVILDLALNHSSVQHPWFKNAVEALKTGDTSNKYIDYYYFNNGNPEKKGWHYAKAGDWYYEGMFWDGMPDLNLYNEDLKNEFAHIMKFWLDKGVSGFRLDAVKEFVSGNTAENVKILTWINHTAKQINKDAYIVGENWDTSIGVYDYLKSGINSVFDFPFSGATGAITKTLTDTTKTAKSLMTASENADKVILQNGTQATKASFFTNHDSPRAFGFLRRDPNLIKTAWGINLMQTGQSFVYYGEEIAMAGSGKDENKRAPMQWSQDKNAQFMCYGPPSMETQEHLLGTVEMQINDETSVYNYIKKAISIRNKYPQIARGQTAVLNIEADAKVCFVSKEFSEEKVVIAYNLSNKEQSASVEAAGVSKVADTLSADNSSSKLANQIITMPPYSITILK